MKYLFALLFIGGLFFGMADVRIFPVFLLTKFISARMLIGAGVVAITMNVQEVE